MIEHEHEVSESKTTELQLDLAERRHQSRLAAERIGNLNAILVRLDERWRIIRDPSNSDGIQAVRADGLQVIVSYDTPPFSSRTWLHVSCTKTSKTGSSLPEWIDLKTCKELFIGEDEEALQIFPPKAEWVDIHPAVLHLWCLPGERLVGDMRGPEGMI